MSSIDHQTPIVGSADACGAERRLLRCASERDTQAIAEALARSPALANATIALHGDLGAGKTTFVRHLLRALGIAGRIKSPTYAVVEPHQAPAAPAWPAGLAVSHFDFYRFDDPREWEDAGLRDLFAEPGLKLVEWPQKAGALMPRADLSVEIGALGDDEREIVLRAGSAVGRQLIAAVAR